jgi:hypothetical protein
LFAKNVTPRSTQLRGTVQNSATDPSAFALRGGTVVDEH